MLITDTIQVKQELLALLSEFDEFKGAWRALGTIAPERRNSLRRFATIESIGSSTRSEGSQLTDREVERPGDGAFLLVLGYLYPCRPARHPYADFSL